MSHIIADAVSEKDQISGKRFFNRQRVLIPQFVCRGVIKKQMMTMPFKHSLIDIDDEAAAIHRRIILPPKTLAAPLILNAGIVLRLRNQLGSERQRKLRHMGAG